MKHFDNYSTFINENLNKDKLVDLLIDCINKSTLHIDKIGEYMFLNNLDYEYANLSFIKIIFANYTKNKQKQIKAMSKFAKTDLLYNMAIDYTPIGGDSITCKLFINYNKYTNKDVINQSNYIKNILYHEVKHIEDCKRQHTRKNLFKDKYKTDREFWTNISTILKNNEYSSTFYYLSKLESNAEIYRIQKSSFGEKYSDSMDLIKLTPFKNFKKSILKNNSNEIIKFLKSKNITLETFYNETIKRITRFLKKIKK